MEKIPTAEEILKETDSYSHIDDGGDKVFYSGFVESLMIEFAKLHVDAALKEAVNNAELKHVMYTENDYCIDENSILKSYPLDKIK